MRHLPVQTRCRQTCRTKATGMNVCFYAYSRCVFLHTSYSHYASAALYHHGLSLRYACRSLLLAAYFSRTRHVLGLSSVGFPSIKVTPCRAYIYACTGADNHTAASGISKRRNKHNTTPAQRRISQTIRHISVAEMRCLCRSCAAWLATGADDA
jgi:hypothetical protein